MTIILFGTSAFAIPFASVLRSIPDCALLGVIARPDKPAGRGQHSTPPPLAAWACDHGVRLWQPETKQELTTLLHDQRPDVAVVAAYGKIIPAEALAVARLGFVNVHPSLLPRHRGPSPIQTAIMSGDTETGVTLIVLDAAVDHGPIIAQERTALSPTTTRCALEQELADRGAALLSRVLPEYLAGRIIPRQQDHTLATTTPLLSREHGRIDWHESAAFIERKVRAYEGWPGTWCVLPDDARLKIPSATVDGPTNTTPGSIVRSNNRFDVACGDGVLLTIITVQPAGGTVMDGASFLRGLRGHDVLR